MAMPKPFLESPVVRQLRSGDLFGRGPAVTSKHTRAITPRTSTADRVVQSVCLYCVVGCGQRVSVKDEKVVRGGDATVPAGVRVVGGWWVHGATYDAWQQRLRTAVDELHARDPLADGLSRGAARDLLALPDESLLDGVARDAGLEQEGGHIRWPRPRSRRSGGG
jgi:Molybdopterin oxidoreductase Fe4S4 domain